MASRVQSLQPCDLPGKMTPRALQHQGTARAEDSGLDHRRHRLLRLPGLIVVICQGLKVIREQGLNGGGGSAASRRLHSL